MVAGALVKELRRETESASGAYAIRVKENKKVVYVGESHRGRMWKTLLRHFQAPESFRKVRETGVFATSPARYEVAVWITSKGKRTRASQKAADQAASRAQAEWINKLTPSMNKDDGFTYDLPDEDEDPWGGLLEKNPDKTIGTCSRANDLAWKYLLGDEDSFDMMAEVLEESCGIDLREQRSLAPLVTGRKRSKKRSLTAAKWTDLVWRTNVALYVAHMPSPPPPWAQQTLGEYAGQWLLAEQVNVFLMFDEVGGASATSGKVTIDIPRKVRAMRALQSRFYGAKKGESFRPAERVWSDVMVSTNEPNERNPSSHFVLVELGKLTALRWKGGASHWPLAAAPSLVYDDKGRLLIVYDAAISSEHAPGKARDEYIRSHWGEQPKHATVHIGELAWAPFVTCGVGTSITYTTRKGSREIVDYEHEWGEGASGPFRAPTVRKGARERYALSGGTYRVTERGIVG